MVRINGQDCEKTGISVSSSYGIPVPELVRLVGRTGFDAVSPEWDENADFAETAEAARCIYEQFVTFRRNA